MARGKHLFPFRTEQLSPTAPMVLGSQGPGRVGRRRFISVERAVLRGGPFSFCGPALEQPVALLGDREPVAAAAVAAGHARRPTGARVAPDAVAVTVGERASVGQRRVARADHAAPALAADLEPLAVVGEARAGLRTRWWAPVAVTDVAASPR